MSITRRQLLISGLYVGGAGALGIGCSDSGPSSSDQPDGGSSGDGSVTGLPDGGSASDWIITGALFVEGSGGTFDLKTTLPAGATVGGTFGVDPSGVALPTGMSLSADGILSVGSATASIVDGVVFTYETA